MSGVRLAYNDYSGWIDLAGLTFPTREELISFVLNEAGRTDDGKRFFWLAKTDGQRIQVIDQDGRGEAWLMDLAPELAATDDPQIEEEEEYLSLLGKDPVFPRASLAFHLLLLLYAVIVRNGSLGVFAELRRYIRILQYAHAYGWGKDVNNAVLGGSSGGVKTRRALAFALTHFLVFYGKKVFFILVAILLYTIYDMA